MVCCAILSLFLAGLIWCFRKAVWRGHVPALEWRLVDDAVGDVQTAMPVASTFRVSARFASVGDALKGLGAMVRNEHNAWVHLAATVGVVLIGVAVGLRSDEWRWMVVAIFWVWCAEALNTALEQLCDVVSPEQNDAIGLAKDAAAGGVLVSAVGVALLGGLTLLPHLGFPSH